MMGLGVVRGSSSRGAVPATLALVRLLRAGETVAVAADGPRGPHQCTDDGLVRLATAAGRSVAAVAAVASAGWSLPTWDRMLIPTPFARVVIVWRASVKGDLQGALEDGVQVASWELASG